VEFCAGHISGGRDACQGDSGGPLICLEHSQPILYGVTSWGDGCGESGSPGIYAKVAPQITWMAQIRVSATKVVNAKFRKI